MVCSSSSSPTLLTTSTPLTKNQLKNEAKRKAKLEKFQAKQSKLIVASTQPSSSNPATKSTHPLPSSSSTPSLDLSTLTTFDLKLNHPMPNAYDPKFVEHGWNEWWEKNKCFQPKLNELTHEPLEQGTFVVPIPPPNVTGSLHLGHALTISIQDALVRYHRMLGKTVLYNPGCDHAGIATQSVVEKRLMKEHQQTRHDLGRSLFLEKVWEWKMKNGENIYHQMKKLGASLDWSKAKFTMDPDLSEAVTEAFLQLHQRGLIYRSTKLVNWCSFLTTALSNLEVEAKEVHGPTPLSIPGFKAPVMVGLFYYFAYPLSNLSSSAVSDTMEKETLVTLHAPSDACQEIVVATTRLETMLGDVAIAVHPEDERYKALIGKTVDHPFLLGRTLPIVADPFVDPKVGTGAVKITPAHDQNDFEVASRHQLPLMNIFNDDGTMNSHAGPQFMGLHRFEARTRVLEALKQKHLLRDVQPHSMVVPICSRTGDIIEPRLKPQWYVKCDEMAQRAMDVVKSGELTILPKASEKEWFHWLSNIQDWCISRQLWWGHRIPAYFLKKTDDPHQDSSDPQFWFVAKTYDEAQRLALARFPSWKTSSSTWTLEQDEDVLDTWFSSGLWPFSIFGWPEKTVASKLFYPTTLLETGWDILFFWVARMVMLGTTLTHQVPFKHVFCHAMVRDAHGRKMSKSLGNVIDPMDVIQGISLASLHQRLTEGNLDPKEIEKAKSSQKKDFPKGISECGADALRFALCAYTSTGRDINLDILRVEGYRKFCNKVWQATRFCLRQLQQVHYLAPSSLQTMLNDGQALHLYFESLHSQLSIPERWILAKLNTTIASVHAHFSTFQFMSATSVLHQFWLYDICDVFLEICKDPRFQTEYMATWPTTLYVCFDHGLKLLHPFMPFVTEELWQRLSLSSASSLPSSSSPSFLMLAKYPQEVARWQPVGSDMMFMNLFLELVKLSRSFFTTYPLATQAVYIHSTHSPLLHFFSTYIHVYLSLMKAPSLQVHFETPPLSTLSTRKTSEDVRWLTYPFTMGHYTCTFTFGVQGPIDQDKELEFFQTKRSHVLKLKEHAQVLQQVTEKTKNMEEEEKVEENEKEKPLSVHPDEMKASLDLEKVKAWDWELDQIQVSLQALKLFMDEETKEVHGL
ncbi:hypothetical protein HMI55_003661 [Coelomomyces lativittatus]|nr:hypothetical protein HMI55_003661 [Coelomomyces lativittatus]